MSSCIEEITICVVRGDAFSLDVGLSAAYSEVADNPSDYIGNLVFRETQDDADTPYLTLTVVPEVNPDPLPGDPPIYLRFAATAAQTQALPDWKYVAYCELSQPVSPEPSRLFNAKVNSND